MSTNMHDIIEIAEQIGQSSTPTEPDLAQQSTPAPTPPAPGDAGIPARPARIGVDRPQPETYNPADFIGKTEGAPALEPHTVRRAGSSGTYTHSYAVSSAQYAVRDLPARPEHHAVAKIKKLETAWAAVEAAKAKADAAVDAIPAGIRKAEDERARALADATGPVSLPSSADVRAYLEREAMAACRSAVAERRRYDALAEELADELAKALAASVPAQADAVLKRVRDLEAAVRDLRQATDAVVTAASAAAPGRERAPLPREADISALADLEAEVGELVKVASNPTRPRLEPSLERRAQINAEQMHTPGGFTEDFIALAKTERAEEYRQTRHTWGVPLSRLGQAQA